MALIRKVRGHVPEIGENTFLAETATIIGDVTIGKDCSIWYGAVLRGDVNTFSLRDNHWCSTFLYITLYFYCKST